MITPDMLTEALKTAHSTCEGEGGCIHADAYDALIQGNSKDLSIFLQAAIITGLELRNDPTLTLFYAGLHAGYRLRQIEESQPLPKEKVN